MSAILIRGATSEDFPHLRMLEDSIFPEDPWTDGMIAEELAAPSRAYFLALLPPSLDDSEETASSPEGQVVGYGGVSLGYDADIMTVGVLPQARGKGIGRMLVDAMKNAASAHGAERIFLEVRDSNQAAQTLYEKCGFERIGRVRGYFRNPLEDAITMRLQVLSENNLS